MVRVSLEADYMVSNYIIVHFTERLTTAVYRDSEKRYPP